MPEQAAYFEFDYPPAPETFVFQLTDPVRIQEARDILSGKEKEKVHASRRWSQSRSDHDRLTARR